MNFSIHHFNKKKKTHNKMVNLSINKFDKKNHESIVTKKKSSEDCNNFFFYKMQKKPTYVIENLLYCYIQIYNKHNFMNKFSCHTYSLSTENKFKTIRFSELNQNYILIQIAVSLKVKDIRWSMYVNGTLLEYQEKFISPAQINIINSALSVSFVDLTERGGRI